MTRLTTHVLDTARGLPAANIAITLYRGGALLHTTRTNADGRCDAPLLQGADFEPGRYELVFDLAAYFAAHHPGLPDPPFLEQIVLRFAVADVARHWHIPLLVSPYGYATYRGS